MACPVINLDFLGETPTIWTTRRIVPTIRHLDRAHIGNANLPFMPLSVALLLTFHLYIAGLDCRTRFSWRPLDNSFIAAREDGEATKILPSLGTKSDQNIIHVASTMDCFKAVPVSNAILWSPMQD